MSGDYKRAKKEFEKILRRAKKSHANNSTRIENEIKGCDMALIKFNSMNNVRLPKKLPSEINTNYSELSPLLIGNDFYFSTKCDTSDYEIVRCNYPAYNYPQRLLIQGIQGSKGIMTNFSANKEMAVFSMLKPNNENQFSCIYRAKLIDSTLSNISILGSAINNQGYSNTQASIATLDDKQALFFVSNRPGGIGGYDIYYSFLSDTTFEDINLLPTSINTEGDEVTPFYCNNCQSLFFSSNFHPGLGGFDVFKSEWKEGRFTEPKNLGQSLNSRLNDLYYTMNHEQHISFFVSNRNSSNNENTNNCCNDIYSLELPIDSIENDTTGEIIEVDSVQIFRDYFSTLLPLSLFFDNDEPNPKSRLSKTDADYESTVQPYLNKQKYIEKKYGEGLNQLSKEDAELAIQLFFKDSVWGNKLRLDTILQKLKILMLKDVAIHILVKGFTSSLASNEYNRNLASRRIQSLLNWINQFESGFFKPYLASGKFQISELDIGEDESTEVSDNPNDLKNSVYSLKACNARRISILKIEIGN